MNHASACVTPVQNGHEPLSPPLLEDRYPVYSVSRCRQAWDWMFQTLQTPAAGDWVRNEVTASWQRCLEDYALTLPSPSSGRVGQGGYDHGLRGRNTDLDLLDSILKNLAPQITSEADVALILADEHCVIQGMTEPHHGGILPMLCRQIGIDWSESVVGNNGVGTSALLSYPEAFAGEEHFSKALHGFATAGFPIIRRDGRCVAIIGLVAAHTNDPLVLGSLARLLGLGVEHEFQKNIYPNGCQIKIETALNNTGADQCYANRSGFVIVDQAMRIQAINTCARIVLGLPANGPIAEKRLDEYLRTECCNWFQQLVEHKPVTAQSGTGIQLRLSLDRLPAKLMATVANEQGMNKGVQAPSLCLEQTIVSKLMRLQRHRVPILICGESGVGKEYLLKKAYAQGDRCHAPFIAVNCASMPRELIESELFGYEAGSFTGARGNGKPGKFVLADKGTLFLDEIGDMNLELQTTLLRVLESSEFYPIGGTRPVHVDVQVVAATNIDLGKAVESGKFRRDLYYRLNGAQIKVPPLRERDDRQLVIEQVFALVLQSLSMSQVKGLSEAVMNLFLKHPWPGNVRELHNVLRQAVSMSDQNEIVLADLAEDFLAEPETFRNTQVESVDSESPWRDNPLDRVGQGMTLAEWEKWGLQQALQHNRGNICQTARALGITRSTIYKKISQYGIQR